MLQNKLLKMISAVDSCLDVVEGCKSHVHELETLGISPSADILPSIRAYRRKFVAVRRNLDSILEQSQGTSNLVSLWPHNLLLT